jgi:hypothetical protein
MWLDAINHCQGDCPSCPIPRHKCYIWRPEDRDAALETLMFVISAAEDLIHNSRPDVGSTQSNKSLQVMKSKYCDKRLNFWISFTDWFAIAVIDHSKQSRRQDCLPGVLGGRGIPKPWELALMADRTDLPLDGQENSWVSRIHKHKAQRESAPPHWRKNKATQSVKAEIEKNSQGKP